MRVAACRVIRIRLNMIDPVRHSEEM
jgi:hypothetical protein